MKQQICHIVAQLQPIYSPKEACELAYWIVEETTGLTRTQILIQSPPAIEIPELDTIIERLRKCEPVQYIFGHVYWMDLDLCVNPSTLIPRPETAELVNWVVDICDNSLALSFVDIGTGSGCIAIAIKKMCPKWHVSAVDVSLQAITVAKENAQKNNVSVCFKQMDILTNELELVDVIVSNPPYICHGEKSTMDNRVLKYEPHTALFVPDSDPLLFYRRIASMKSAKMLFFEINEAYGNEVCEMLVELGYTDVQLKIDIYGKARMVFGRIEV